MDSPAYPGRVDRWEATASIDMVGQRIGGISHPKHWLLRCKYVRSRFQVLPAFKAGEPGPSSSIAGRSCNKSSILHSLASSFLHFFLPIAGAAAIRSITTLSRHTSHCLLHTPKSGISKPYAINRYYTPEPPCPITEDASDSYTSPRPIQHVPQILGETLRFKVFARLLQIPIRCSDWSSDLFKPELNRE